ncbi:adenylosuccinate synthetase [Paenibacillus sp. JCM 10914]|nr:adenylosuccinate synthetase [Paenibacillus sp. JCM 10914]
MVIKNVQLQHLYGTNPINVDDMVAVLLESFSFINSYVEDTTMLLQQAYMKGELFWLRVN